MSDHLVDFAGTQGSGVSEPAKAHFYKESHMGRHLLMQSLLGHLALLQEKHPKKAETAIARKMKRAAEQSTKPQRQNLRRAA